MAHTEGEVEVWGARRDPDVAGADTSYHVIFASCCTEYLPPLSKAGPEYRRHPTLHVPKISSHRRNAGGLVQSLLKEVYILVNANWHLPQCGWE